MSDTSAARLLTLTDREYHADAFGDVPSLSSSTATTLLRQSPYHAWAAHPRLGNMREEPTDEMERGTLIHALVLGTAVNLAVIDAADWRTKDAKAAREAARAAGRTPILRVKYDDAQAFAASVKREIDALGIVFDGASEQAVTWIEHATDGTPVVCKGKLDHVWLDSARVLDVKTCRSAHPRAIQSHVIEYGYDVQHAAYTSALRKLAPGLAGRESLTFLFCEDAPGKAIVQPVRLDGSFRELGARKWQRAIDEWARCLRTNHWPAYQDGGTLEIQPPGWAIIEEGM